MIREVKKCFSDLFFIIALCIYKQVYVFGGAHEAMLNYRHASHDDVFYVFVIQILAKRDEIL